MSHHTPEREMWQKIVMQAVLDATHPNPSAKGGANTTTKDQREAHAWLTRGGEHFRFACNNANLDPDFIRDSYINNRDALKAALEG